jgi:hypothetical protein
MNDKIAFMIDLAHLMLVSSEVKTRVPAPKTPYAPHACYEGKMAKGKKSASAAARYKPFIHR